MSRNTGGKIPSIVDKIPPEAILYLVNAAHFKGDWDHKFEASSTGPGPFHLTDGSAVDMPMMHGTQQGTETALFQAAKLPFASDSKGTTVASMYVLVPTKGNDLRSLEASLTPENWKRWTSSIQTRTAILSLPRFNTDFKAGLVDPLKALGMTDAFSPTLADFRGITKDPNLPQVWIGSVDHRATIDVNENGAEAAAATAVGVMAGSSAVETSPLVINVDRPFLFAITDGVNGEIMFLGEVRDPRS